MGLPMFWSGEEGLQNMYIAAALTTLISSAALMGLTFSQPYQCTPIHIAFPTRNALTNLATVEHVGAGDFCPRVSAIVLGLVAFVGYAYVSLKRWKDTREDMMKCTNSSLWMFQFIIAPVITITIANESGVLELMTLMQVAATTLAAMGFFYVGEVLMMAINHNEQSIKDCLLTDKQKQWGYAYSMGGLMWLWSWITILIAFAGAVVRVHPGATNPAVYAMVIGEFILAYMFTMTVAAQRYEWIVSRFKEFARYAFMRPGNNNSSNTLKR